MKFYEIHVVKSANMARRNEKIISSSYITLYAGQNEVLAYIYYYFSGNPASHQSLAIALRTMPD